MSTSFAYIPSTSSGAMRRAWRIVTPGGGTVEFHTQAAASVAADLRSGSVIEHLRPDPSSPTGAAWRLYDERPALLLEAASPGPVDLVPAPPLPGYATLAPRRDDR